MESASRRLIAEFSARRTLRSGSLITTVFGDAIAPRGGTIWLGSLIGIMAEFGIGERLVRTSVYRLVQDGWLQSVQIGRRSYYSLSGDGRQRFAQATHKIYAAPAESWDKNWTLLLLHELSAERRDSLRKELAWLGFGALSANVLAHPSPDMDDLNAVVQRLDAADAIVVMRATAIRNADGMQDFIPITWDLAELEQRYGAFIKRFRPMLAASKRGPKVLPKAAFLVRTLLIQEYRKILLRDPQLPAELLPANWHGNAAYQLCRNLYRAVYEAADAYLSDKVETAGGALPPANKEFLSRFGGLES